jgi:pyruvate decarboxylase
MANTGTPCLPSSDLSFPPYFFSSHSKYNNISNWDYPSLLKVLGDRDGVATRSYTVSTKDELSKLLDNQQFASTDCIQLVEVMMEALDAPRALQVQAELSGQTNKYDEVTLEGLKEKRDAL